MSTADEELHREVVGCLNVEVFKLQQLCERLNTAVGQLQKAAGKLEACPRMDIGELDRLQAVIQSEAELCSADLTRAAYTLEHFVRVVE